MSTDPISLTPDVASGRRTFLRRAAVVGGAAWTAPMIVGSLASPAGALTLPGCSLYVLLLDRNGNSAGAAISLSASTTPVNCGSAITAPATCGTLTRITTNGTAPVGTVTFSADYDDDLAAFSYTFGETATPCSIVAEGHTPGTSNSTACQTNPTLTAVAGNPSSITRSVPAADVNNVHAWAYVVVACS